ncbi:hypothetical protein ACRE_048760 [Hapsidospora chrysogenum ATCC 11550]|uniref:JmjC domain-containing protein n=1 Tax=Hapsidospora chrysogenum (strain ATCC 11550 / CBS 779.69 / DSM 880 / IAM 14645 / JCM 23072 / IMI 49137) TaxID=857340 RepID=A0A086T4S4_HAPC1|nr:hypothetical protein ACRE_048760 [Hapsidospora chrysogenum ATCC 11550]
MPTSLHPQAKFDPIPPDLDLVGLVDRTPNFKWVQRVSRSQIRGLGHQEFEKVVFMHVIQGGKPLVIDGYDGAIPKWLFNADWLEKTYDKKQENVRDIGSGTDIPMTTGHYLRSMKTLTNQWTPNNFRDERRQRLYLKDIDCPVEWQDALRKVIHPSLFYLNDNSNGDTQDRDPDVFPSEASAAPAGDLMSSLPEEMRAQNLMCYIGHEGTYTPAHREMCASLGQNIMVEASDGTKSDEKAGSSIWFMTEKEDREVVREYFLSMLGHDIEIEKHFAQINAWKKAPFDVLVVEQRPGDFILIPPLAAHQVWNRGTRTMKVAWNRTTPETLDMALHEALPKARLVCRDEQYKNKAIIYYTLSKYYRQLQELEENAELTQMSFMGFGQDIVKSSPRAIQLAGDFKRLLRLFTEILVDEMFAYKEKDVEFLEFDSCVTCSYCRSNIFNRFLTCKHCVRTLINGDQDAYDICMECYAMGRSCVCLSKLQWCEQWSWSELVENYETWRAMVIKNDGFVDLNASPQPIEVAKQRMGKKSLAQICQEALRRRPFKDITKPEREKTPSDSEPDAGEERPKKKYKRKKKKGEVRRCHVCCHKDYAYRVHMCTNPGCMEGYCYGVLYRAFDMMPQKVLEDEQWQCPKCLGICNCGACRRTGNTDPYTPKNTSLGHDTRPIADDRSVEALVDFRIHNLGWLKAAGEDSRSKDSKRMKRLREQADNAKAQDVTGQEEVGRTMLTNGEAKNSYGPSTNGAHANGHVEPSSVPDGHEPATAEYPHHELEQLRTAIVDEVELPPIPMEAPPPEEDQGMSSYPDPSVLARQRIGMGYYEQDDTPDKILFDPYQAPSEEAIRQDMEEPNEFIKKSIRAAKRKARRENDDDPDFVIGKNNHKKQRTARGSGPQPDPLDSMDPALFSQEPTAPEAVMGEAPAEQAAVEASEGQTGGAENGSAQRPDSARDRPATRESANEPSLRPTRPRISYVEADEGDIEEYEEEDPAQAAPREAEEAPVKSALDLAADAVRAMFGKPASAHAAASEPGNKIPKKRGRPPKHLSQAAQREDTQTPAKTTEPAVQRTEPVSSTRTRSGRTVRSILPNFSGAGPGSDSDDADKDYSAGTRPVSGAQTERRGRGRPRKSGITTVMAASGDQVKAEADEAERTESRDKSPVEQPVRRGRGRPRKSETAARAPSPKRDATPEGQFLSMAERMALKGKKFKIGKRTSKGLESIKNSPASTPRTVKQPSRQAEERPETPPEPEAQPSAPPSDSEQGDEFFSPEEDNDSVGSSPTTFLKPAPRPLTAPSGRTVVRIGAVDEDEYEDVQDVEDEDEEAEVEEAASPAPSDSGSDVEEAEDVVEEGGEAEAAGGEGEEEGVEHQNSVRPP